MARSVRARHIYQDSDLRRLELAGADQLRLTFQLMDFSEVDVSFSSVKNWPAVEQVMADIDRKRGHNVYLADVVCLCMWVKAHILVDTSQAGIKIEAGSFLAA